MLTADRPKPSVSPFSCSRYVAEMMANRVLRFFQQPAGVYHSSVFHQFSGGVGPSCLAIDSNGNLYVGHYEVRGTPVCGR